MERKVTRARGFLAVLVLGLMSGSQAQDQDPKEEGGLLPRQQAIMLKNPAADAWLLDVESVGQRLVAVGGRGVIVVSDDGGATWKQVVSPVDVTLTTLRFADERNGWAGGHEATLLRTRDGGNTWTVEQTSPDVQDPILKIWFSERHGGFAVGGRSLMYRFDGNAWQRGDLVAENDDEFMPHLFDITESRNGTLFVAAEAGHLFRSRDGGQSWQLLTTPYNGSFFGITQAGAEGHLLLYGMLGNVLVSSDDGDTWRPVDTGTRSSLFSHHGSPLRLVGTDGALLEVDMAGGEPVFDRKSSPVSRRTITALAPAGRDRWAAATTRGIVIFDAP